MDKTCKRSRAMTGPRLARWAVVLLAAAGSVPVLAAEPAHARAVEEYYQGRMYRNSRGETLPYRLFVPPGRDPKNKLPLVFHLEGNGSQGNDLRKPWRHWPQLCIEEWAQAKYPCLYLTPRCLEGQMWVRGGAGLTQSLRLALEVLDRVAAEHNADTDRLYVLGFSMGGFGTWDVIGRLPDKFAAAIPISGGGDPSRARSFVNLPIWAFHGGADPVCPVAGTRAMVNALRQLGGHPRYTEYPGAQHGDALGKAVSERDLLPWLFSQRRGGKDTFGAEAEAGSNKR
ncbi:MAG: dienelactone hydrolase family protein [Planctomycetes bacterium]|nr:dienelactone hydrolase family protein [Planctomycetota bacterium]